nr:unnamed protein product [Callosobruchus chinensis]
MYAAYPGGGPPPHYAPPPTFLQPHPPPPPLQHHVQVPPLPMVQSQPSPVAHYSKKRRYVFDTLCVGVVIHIFLQIYEGISVYTGCFKITC